MNLSVVKVDRTWDDISFVDPRAEAIANGFYALVAVADGATVIGEHWRHCRTHLNRVLDVKESSCRQERLPGACRIEWVVVIREQVEEGSE